VKEGKEEFLWLSLTGLNKVVKSTLEGKVVLELPFPSQCAAYEGKVERYVPTNLAVAPGGDIYVADGYGLSWIHQFDARGSYIRSFGGPGSEVGKLNCPHGIWIDTRGKVPEVLVADRANVRLQSFSLDGKPLAIVREELRHPCHFDEREGDLLVPDLHGRVSIFDRENKLVVHLGDNVDPAKRGRNDLAREGWVEGQFVAPHGATWDSKGNIYVAEWVRVGRVTKLRRVG
jgi:DNA-binding beta-propeller fold protein YncE